MSFSPDIRISERNNSTGIPIGRYGVLMPRKEESEVFSKVTYLLWIVGSTGISCVGNTFVTGRVLVSSTGDGNLELGEPAVDCPSRDAAGAFLEPASTVKLQALPLNLLTSRASGGFPQPLRHPQTF